MNKPQFSSNQIVTQVLEEKKKVLLVDDDTAIRRYIEVVLKKANFDVVAAEDGLAAMKIGMNQRMDAVIADAFMPVMGGIDLCRMLRSNSKNIETPFVIISGAEQKCSDSDKALANAYVMKNTELQTNLLSTLSRLLESKVYA
jgi:PleD family two-component response regulator